MENGNSAVCKGLETMAIGFRRKTVLRGARKMIHPTFDTALLNCHCHACDIAGNAEELLDTLREKLRTNLAVHIGRLETGKLRPCRGELAMMVYDDLLFFDGIRSQAELLKRQLDQVIAAAAILKHISQQQEV